jgi:hypothetical protein
MFGSNISGFCCIVGTGVVKVGVIFVVIVTLGVIVGIIEVVISGVITVVGIDVRGVGDGVDAVSTC